MMTWYWWLAIAAAGYGCFSLWRLIRKSEADQRALEAAINAHIGREPDHFYYLRSHAPGPRRVLAAFVPEQRIYLSNYAEPFEPNCFLGPGDIRSWAIEWDTGIDNNNRTYKRRFSLRIAVKSVERPLVKIDCQDEATAYQMREIFSQAFGDRGERSP